LNSSRAQGTSANTPDLRRVFVARVHQLLEMGYRRMEFKPFAFQEEPVITGELARAMNAVIDDDSSPLWTHHFSVQDEQVVNDVTLKGKHRKRIDIGVLSSRPRPRNHFSFEAKSLSDRHPLRDYLGNNGLRRFLRGEYAKEDRDAGMLGYVQSESEGEWAERLQTELQSRELKHSVRDSCFAVKHEFKSGPSYTYLSRHFRDAVSSQIDIYHTLLLFH
jgi:hypothetical protein